MYRDVWASPSAAMQQQQQHHVERPSICKYFLGGGCLRGDQCQFLHELPDESHLDVDGLGFVFNTGVHNPNAQPANGRAAASASVGGGPTGHAPAGSGAASVNADRATQQAVPLSPTPSSGAFGGAHTPFTPTQHPSMREHDRLPERPVHGLGHAGSFGNLSSGSFGGPPANSRAGGGAPNAVVQHTHSVQPPHSHSHAHHTSSHAQQGPGPFGAMSHTPAGPQHQGLRAAGGAAAAGRAGGAFGAAAAFGAAGSQGPVKTSRPTAPRMRYRPCEPQLPYNVPPFLAPAFETPVAATIQQLSALLAVPTWGAPAHTPAAPPTAQAAISSLLQSYHPVSLQQAAHARDTTGPGAALPPPTAVAASAPHHSIPSGAASHRRR